MNQSRRLAALMFTDMVGYSALAREDERLARELVDEQRDLVRRELQAFHGNELQTTGDGFFLEFASALDAVECAVSIQTKLFEKNRYLPEERRIRIRIGIHIGEIFSNSFEGTDRFGNNVNVAARLEPMAPPGGICISRQVVDQVEDRLSHLKFKRLGKTELKNIRGGAELYHVIAPHMEAAEPRPNRLRFLVARFRALPTNSKLSLGSLLAGVSLASILLTGTITYALYNVFLNEPSATRGPASSDRPTIAINLEHGWEYRAAENQEWAPFDIRRSWKYADQLAGEFEIRNRFRVTTDDLRSLQTPSLVVGLIRDRHQIYLNQNFIGGGERHTDLQHYPFDQTLLKADSSTLNEILIKGFTRPTLNPGISRLSDVGTGIGDFHEVSAKVRSNILSFQVLRNLYFGLALVILSASTLFMFLRRVPTGFYYLWSILVFSTCQLAYFSPWINETFQYPLVRFLKVVGITMAALAVIPAFSRMKKWNRIELFGNALIPVSLVAFAVFLFDSELKPSAYTERYNLVLGLTAVLAAIWIAVMIASTVYDVVKKTARTNLSYRVAYLATSVSMFSSMLVSQKAGQSDTFVPDALRRSFVDFSLAFPLLFSFFVVSVAIYDYIQQSRAASAKRKRDSLILEASHLIAKGRNLDLIIGDIQRMLCTYLEAEKSTIYLFPNGPHESSNLLIQDYHHGPANGPVTRSEIPADRGIIGYALKNQSALNLPDVRTDSRFNSDTSPYARSRIGKYSSGACMIIPLTAAGATVGVMTFSDKSEGQSFSQEDFETAVQISTTLTLLFESRRRSAS